MAQGTLKKDFKDSICKPFCSYFRENSKEDLACHGASVVVDLAGLGRFDIRTLSGLDQAIDFRGRHDRDLDETVCARCAFRAEDCDFQSTDNRDTSEPCGGYRVLALLRMAGIDVVA